MHTTLHGVSYVKKRPAISLAALIGVTVLLSTGCPQSTTAGQGAPQDGDSTRIVTPGGLPTPGPMAISPSPTASPAPAAGQPVTPSALPEGLRKLPFLNPAWQKTHGGAQPGQFFAVDRGDRQGVDFEKVKLPTVPRPARDAELQDQSPPQTQPNPDRPTEFEFFDLKTRKAFKYVVKRGELLKISNAVAPDAKERRISTRKPTQQERALEDQVVKSWSNANDSRTRRAIADGYSDTHSLYQSFANYGGCSATVLYASSSYMVALTAGHCVFSGSAFSTSTITPRRNESTTSPTWGTWTPYAFGYYPGYVTNNCETTYGSGCIENDIALVIASPNADVQSIPDGLGWGYRSKSELDGYSKYRRGYPGCGYAHSPSPCDTDTLYGDGALSVDSFSEKDSDGWDRQLQHSSDMNPGDSGSSLYYYRDGNTYTFAVNVAEPTSCDTDCSSSRPNYARAHTQEWFDFINSIVP